MRGRLTSIECGTGILCADCPLNPGEGGKVVLKQRGALRPYVEVKAITTDGAPHAEARIPYDSHSSSWNSASYTRNDPYEPGTQPVEAVQDALADCHAGAVTPEEGSPQCAVVQNAPVEYANFIPVSGGY